MDKKTLETLKGFETVWRRVGAVKSAAAAAEGANVKLMPGRDSRSRAVRYMPGHK